MEIPDDTEGKRMQVRRQALNWMDMTKNMSENPEAKKEEV